MKWLHLKVRFDDWSLEDCIKHSNFHQSTISMILTNHEKFMIKSMKFVTTMYPANMYFNMST